MPSPRNDDPSDDPENTYIDRVMLAQEFSALLRDEDEPTVGRAVGDRESTAPERVPAEPIPLTPEQRSHVAAMGKPLAAAAFALHFQPIVKLATRRIVGAEALARRQTLAGLTPPADFIPASEETGFIGQLGAWVLRAACAQLRLIHECFPADPPFLMSVNVSPRQLTPAFVEEVRTAVAGAAVPPSALVLEITQRVRIEDLDRAARIARALKEIGVRLAIDNFGTGFASLDSVRRLTPDVIKLPRSFVSGVAEEGEPRWLAEAAIELAVAVGASASAVGVETEEQADALHAMGCETAQGFFFAKPMPIDELVAFIDERNQR